MKFSVSLNNSKQNFIPVETDDIAKIATHIQYYNYSLSVFKNHDRKNVNFVSADAIALDFDGGLSLNQAKMRFRNKRHIIAPSRNHQKEKNGVITDRFRVILFLEKRITNYEDYKATVENLLNDNPEADKACKDAARFFFPSISIQSMQNEGQLLPVIKAPEKMETLDKVDNFSEEKGKLLHKTLQFLAFGAETNRNPTLYAAAKDMQGQGYSIKETIAIISKTVANVDNWYDKKLSSKDIDTIERAYNEPNPNSLRKQDRPSYNFQKIGDLFNTDIKLEWMVNELLIKGGISIFAGPPKSGKSTLVRQLAKSISQGEDFLGRRAEKGKVAYLAFEEHPAMLQNQFKKIGVSDKDEIMIHIGPVYGENRSQSLIDYIQGYGATLVVLDTLALFAGLTDINNYDEVNKAMEEVREIARVTGAHVVLIHHTNKSDLTNMNSIMGSQAFLGAVDAALLLNRVDQKRYITTTGRGLTNFNNCEILFDNETESYSLGMEQDDEF
jgi:hypothetical protein